MISFSECLPAICFLFFPCSAVFFYNIGLVVPNCQPQRDVLYAFAFCLVFSTSCTEKVFNRYLLIGVKRYILIPFCSLVPECPDLDSCSMCSLKKDLETCLSPLTITRYMTQAKGEGRPEQGGGAWSRRKYLLK